MVRRLEASERLPKNDRLEIVQADMRDAEALHRAVRDTDAVVHLAAAKADEKDSEEINVGGARHLVGACRAAGCLRIVNISTQSAKILCRGLYARTKSAADEVFHD
jgi:nucleoside-diphosphate-sugar epimerase